MKVFALVVLAFFLSAAQATPKVIFGTPSRIGSLNPYLISGIESFTVTGFVIEPLARTEPFTQGMRPWLAKNWSVDTKTKTIRVHLREGVMFHNKQPLTAKDVLFTWRSFLNPAYKGEIWRAMWDQVEDVTVVDAQTVDFKLKELRYQVFHNLLTAMRILPEGYYSPVNHGEWSQKIVGSGPFRVERFDSNRTLELKPNVDWWGWRDLKLQVAPGILVKSVADAKLAGQMLAKGELDLYEVPPGHLNADIKGHELKSAFGRGFSFGINFRNKALQDPRVRNALVILWNRPALNAKVFGGKYQLSLDSFSPNSPYYPAGKPIAYNPAGAKRLLTEAGYKRPGSLRLKVLVDSAENERWVGLYQSDAEKVGVKIEIEKVIDESQWWQLIQKGKFELAAFSGPFSQIPHPSVWHSKGPYNSSGIKDDQLDKMLDRLDVEFDDKKRREIQGQLITRLREIGVELPGLFTGKSLFLVSPQVTFDPEMPLEAWHWRKKDQRYSRQ